MRLLYLANAQFPSKAAHAAQIMDMCQAFSRAGAKVTLFGVASKEFKSVKKTFSYYGARNRISSLFIPSKHSYLLRELSLFRRARVKKDTVDVIYTRSLLISLLLSIIGSRAKVIYELHDYDKGWLFRTMLKMASPRLHRVITITTGLKNDLVADGIKGDKIIVLADGVDQNIFHPRGEKKSSRKKLALPPDAFIVTYAGSFQDWKGFPVFLASRKEVRDHHVVFLAIGSDDKGRKEEAGIITIPFCSKEKVAEYLNASDVLVLPNVRGKKISEFYTSPLKLFEYCSMAKPIIVSDLPSLREVVSEKEVFFFNTSPGDLAKTIEYVLLHYGDERVRKKVLACSKKARAQTWEKRAERILSLCS